MASRWRQWDSEFATNILEHSPGNKSCRIFPVSGGRGRPVIDFSTLRIPDIGAKSSPTVGVSSSTDCETNLSELGKVRGRGRRLKVGEQLVNQNKELLQNIQSLNLGKSSLPARNSKDNIFSEEEFPSLSTSTPGRSQIDTYANNGKNGKKSSTKSSRKNVKELLGQLPTNGKQKPSLSETEEKSKGFSRKFLKRLKEPDVCVVLENISETLTHKELMEFFQNFGEVKSLEVRGSSILVTMMKAIACVWIVSCLDETNDVKDKNAAASHDIAMLTVQVLKNMRSDRDFKDFLDSTVAKPNMQLRAYLVNELIKDD